jgi:O-acetyl-ADP-ribose deacetylase (regulator of RNase III)
MYQISVYKGDITQLEVDAIVNAANTSLTGGGGVDGAIHRAAGSELLEACLLLNGCAVGDAKITDAFKLKAKYIIHAVGPVWKGGNYNERELLKSVYQRSIEIAEEKGLTSVAFPNISTGVYRFPKKEAAEIAIRTVRNFSNKKTGLKKVIFAIFDDENFIIYNQLLAEIV